MALAYTAVAGWMKLPRFLRVSVEPLVDCALVGRWGGGLSGESSGRVKEGEHALGFVLEIS